MQIALDLSIKVSLTKTEEKSILKWVKLANQSISTYIDKTKPALFPKSVTHLEMSLVICGEKRIKQLNTQYRNKSKVTDVLSFPMFTNLRKNADDLSMYKMGLHLGDLVICHQVTKKQALEFKLSYEEELIHLMFHGFLHLLGYDHELSKKEQLLMEKMEKKLLRIAKEGKRS